MIIDIKNFLNKEKTYSRIEVDINKLKLSKRKDYYVTPIGFCSNGKGGLSKLELILNPNSEELFKIMHRNKSIKGLRRVGKEQLENFINDLKQVLVDKETCQDFINILCSTEVISKFNL